jgi:hypothetical protein
VRWQFEHSNSKKSQGASKAVLLQFYFACAAIQFTFALLIWLQMKLFLFVVLVALAVAETVPKVCVFLLNKFLNAFAHSFSFIHCSFICSNGYQPVEKQPRALSLGNLIGLEFPTSSFLDTTMTPPPALAAVSFVYS